VTIKSRVVRGGKPEMLPSEQVVPEGMVMLSAGSLIPADGIVLETNDFFVNQAVLTGEAFLVEKIPGIVTAKASLVECTNCVSMGTSVRSGMAHVLNVQTGKSTVFGQIAEHLSLRPAQLEQLFLKETTASFAGSYACGEQCAMKRTIVSLVQPGRTRKEVLEPTAYPESKDDGGQEHAVKAVCCRRRLGSSAARPAR
jgi:cation transport ATPase